MQFMYPQTIRWNLYPLFLYVSLFHENHSLALDPKNCLYKQCIIKSAVPFLEVLFSCIICSYFLVMNHNIPRMIVCNRKQKQHNFLECTVVVTLFTHWELLSTCETPSRVDQVRMLVEWWGWLWDLAVRWQAHQLVLNCLHHISTVSSHVSEKLNYKYPLNFTHVCCKRIRCQSY
jgi:hypothetical protein